MVDPVRVTRREFVSTLAPASMDVKTAAADPRLSGVDVKSADLDGDGALHGTKEIAALFDQIDRVEHDSRPGSLMLVDADGKATQAARPAAALGDLGRAAEIQRRARSAEPGNDDIVFVGMRTETKPESDALAARGRGRFAVTVIGGMGTELKVGTQSFDFRSAAGVRDFADSLGLPQARADRVHSALMRNSDDGREELGRLALVLLRGEQGGSVPSRLVLSGHHAGGTFFGDRGNLSDRAVQELARALPRGAAAIEDIHLAGCYSYGRATLDGWAEAFPNLQTTWGYGHTAPAAGFGAETHEARWESATRGRVGILDRGRGRGPQDAEVIVWSRQGGYHSNEPPRPLAELRTAATQHQAEYHQALEGSLQLGDPHSGPVRDHYGALNDLLEHPDLPPAERATLTDERDRAIRLLYFRDVTRGWSTAHQPVLSRACQKLGEPAPDFTRMSRGTAMQAMDGFLARSGTSTDPDVLAARARVQELKSLEPKAVPLDWIR